MRSFLRIGMLLVCLASGLHAALPNWTLRAKQPLGAFTPQHPPDIEFIFAGPNEFHGFVRIERIDLLTEQSTVGYLPVDAVGEATRVSYKPTVPYGVYRIECIPVLTREETPGPGSKLTFAYAPARDARDLPDDWPLGAHVGLDLPPVPGFRWFRYFSSWAQNNPAKDKFNWDRLDAVIARVRLVGGRLLIANDSTPSWTAPAKPVMQPLVKSATVYPPDDMKDLRTYLDALLQRYDDKEGTLGGLEVWNEPNMPEHWMGTPLQLADMARLFHGAAADSAKRVSRDAPAKIVGIVVGSGHQQDYVNAVIKAGILPYCDAISGHWHEEILAYDRATPTDSLPLHVDLLAKPMHDAGFSLPIWNTESRIACVPREDGKIVAQDELNRRALTGPKFDPKQPWLLDGTNVRKVSERRAAASFVAGTAMLMSLGVEKTFVHSMRNEGWIQDGGVSLAWVALGEFGEQLHALDFHTVVPVAAKVEGGDPAARALAFRFGAPGKPGVVVAWTYLQDTTVGQPKLWQPWLGPQKVRLELTAPRFEVTDLYGRETTQASAANDGLAIPIGEEPVYIRELP